jgi:hypothetical protein
VAGTFLGVMLIAVIGTGALARLDPLLNISTALVGLGSVGLMSLLAGTALVVPIFFARRGIYGVATTVAPAIGGLAIAVATVLAVANYSALTGVDSPVINSLPWLLVPCALVGIVRAQWLRVHRPGAYARIGASRVDEDVSPGQSAGVALERA